MKEYLVHYYNSKDKLKAITLGASYNIAIGLGEEWFDNPDSLYYEIMEVDGKIIRTCYKKPRRLVSRYELMDLEE